MKILFHAENIVMKVQQEIDRLTKKTENLESLLQNSWKEKAKLNKSLASKNQTISKLEKVISELETDNQKLKKKIQRIKKECETSSEEEDETSSTSPPTLMIKDGFPQNCGLSLINNKWLAFSPDSSISVKFFVIGVKENQKFRKLTQTEVIDLWDGRTELLNTQPIAGLGRFYIKETNPDLKNWMIDNGLWPK